MVPLRVDSKLKSLQQLSGFLKVDRDRCPFCVHTKFTLQAWGHVKMQMRERKVAHYVNITWTYDTKSLLFKLYDEIHVMLGDSNQTMDLASHPVRREIFALCYDYRS